METRRQESLCLPISCKVPVPYLKVGPRDRGDLEGRKETAGRGSGIGGGDTNWVGPSPPTGILAPVEGAVTGLRFTVLRRPLG